MTKEHKPEQELWNIANELRGKMGADEFRGYILGFIFYKYMSEKQHLYAGNLQSVDESVGPELTKSKLLGVINKRTTIMTPVLAKPEIERQFEKTLQLLMPGSEPDTVEDIILPAQRKNHQEEEAIKKKPVQPEDTKSPVDGKTSTQLNEALVTKRTPDSFESEQFKMITAHLMQLNKEGNSQVYMVTSATSGDGTSFVASNIASSLAQNTDKKVLIIDCNLRSPALHTIFGHDSNSGLSDYLAGNISLGSVCLASGIDGLTIIPAGRCEYNSFKLLSSIKMENLISGLKARFKDLIIILDVVSPSLLAESGVISKFVDGVAIVACHNKTQRNDIKKLTEMFDKEKIVGVIYNKFRSQNSFLKKFESYFKWFIR